MRALVACVILVAAVRCGADTLYVDAKASAEGLRTFRLLQTAIDAAYDGDTLIIMPGRYEASPSPLAEELCGNCETHGTRVQATYGFIVQGKSLDLVGSGAAETILVTNAGYGVLFDGCAWATISDFTITGGVRDGDGAATDAAIVVRESFVTIRNTEIRDNTDRHENVVVGIGGIIGREGAHIVAVGNTIDNNGWDGMALYRGATAFASDNSITRGRGAGIGVTWDSAATLLRNRISEYWKGIGSFGSSRVIARNNEIFDNLGWGIVATGTSTMEAMNNVVCRNGNCGVALWSDEASLILVNNIITENGWREEWVCPPVGLWMNGEASRLEARHNDVWGNREGDYLGLDDLTGASGNISLRPLFADSLDFSLLPGSACIDAGDPRTTDRDGTPADLGSAGGPGGPPQGR